jgi:hypothetical protein
MTAVIKQKCRGGILRSGMFHAMRRTWNDNRE